MLKRYRDLLSDSSASTTIEYGLIAALTATVALIGISAAADQTTRMWNDIGSQLSEASESMER